MFLLLVHASMKNAIPWWCCAQWSSFHFYQFSTLLFEIILLKKICVRPNLISQNAYFITILSFLYFFSLALFFCFFWIFNFFEISCKIINKIYRKFKYPKFDKINEPFIWFYALPDNPATLRNCALLFVGLNPLLEVAFRSVNFKV